MLLKILNVALISRKKIRSLGLTHPRLRSGHVQKNPVRVVDPAAKIVVPVMVAFVEMAEVVMVLVCHWPR